MSSKPYECGICYNIFDKGDQRPRILPCSHSLCSNCIDRVITEGNHECPFCCKNFTGNSSNDFIINRGLLDLVEMQYKPKSDSETFKDGINMSVEAVRKNYRRKLLNNTLPECQKAKKITQEALQRKGKTKEEYTKTIKEIDTGLDTLRRIKSYYFEHYADAERDEKYLKNMIKEIETKNAKIKDVNDKLDSCKNFASMGPIMDVAKEIGKEVTNVKEWAEEFVSKDLASSSKIFKNLQKAHKCMASIQDTLTKQEKDEKEVSIRGKEKDNLKVVKLSTTVDDAHSYISGGDLHRMCDLEKGKIFSCVELEKGERLFGKIWKSRKGIVVQCLRRDEDLPPNAKLIKHEDVLCQTDDSNRMVFLELGVSGKSLGIVYISLISSGKYTSNFYCLCSGHKGVSYCHSKILDVKARNSVGEYIVLGDYEKNTGKGGAPVLSGENWRNEIAKNIYRRVSHKAGTLRVWWVGSDAMISQFVILTKDDNNDYFSCFGQVVEGLDIISGAVAQYRNIREVEIINCGIVLSL